MGFIEWHERMVKKFSSSNISLVILGKALIILSLGVFFVRELAAYVAAMFLFGVLFTIPHWLNSWTTLKNKRLNYSYLILDALGKFFLLIVLGMVFAPLLWPMRWGIVIVGIIMTIPIWKEMMG